MSIVVQPVVCCLGYPVAGNPTQFLMQRIAVAMNLDWTFVTSEVPPERLEDAIRGIRALEFSGIAFLKPHQGPAKSLVDSFTESSIHSGLVRVARRDGLSWLGDDTLGAAILEIIRASGVEANESCLVCGASSLYHQIRLAKNGRDSFSLFQVDKKRSEKEAVGDANPDVFASIESLDWESIPEKLVATPVRYLIIDAASHPPSSKLLAKIPFVEHVQCIFVESNPAWEKAVTTGPLRNARLFKGTDLAAAKAMVSFHFWTGHEPDLGLIRDALDEYCQW